mmetsp:Transcript_31001/g.93751  ORF Transcript_31001/g.93751 Transcript_31001/m.93751 type:complete len:206 (-) Transcript_31001:292-909(-)
MVPRAPRQVPPRLAAIGHPHHQGPVVAHHDARGIALAVRIEPCPAITGDLGLAGCAGCFDCQKGRVVVSGCGRLLQQASTPVPHLAVACLLRVGVGPTGTPARSGGPTLASADLATAHVDWLFASRCALLRASACLVVLRGLAHDALLLRCRKTLAVASLAAANVGPIGLRLAALQGGSQVAFLVSPSAAPVLQVVQVFLHGPRL